MAWPAGKRRKGNQFCTDCGEVATRLMRSAIHVQAFSDNKSEMRYGRAIPLCDACIRLRSENPTVESLREAMKKLRLGRETATAA